MKLVHTEPHLVIAEHTRSIGSQSHRKRAMKSNSPERTAKTPTVSSNTVADSTTSKKNHKKQDHSPKSKKSILSVVQNTKSTSTCSSNKKKSKSRSRSPPTLETRGTAVYHAAKPEWMVLDPSQLQPCGITKARHSDRARTKQSKVLRSSYIRPHETHDHHRDADAVDQSVKLAYVHRKESVTEQNLFRATPMVPPSPRRKEKQSAQMKHRRKLFVRSISEPSLGLVLNGSEDFEDDIVLSTSSDAVIDVSILNTQSTPELPKLALEEPMSRTATHSQGSLPRRSSSLGPAAIADDASVSSIQRGVEAHLSDLSRASSTIRQLLLQENMFDEQEDQHQAAEHDHMSAISDGTIPSMEEGALNSPPLVEKAKGSKKKKATKEDGGKKTKRTGSSKKSPKGAPKPRLALKRSDEKSLKCELSEKQSSEGKLATNNTISPFEMTWERSSNNQGPKGLASLPVSPPPRHRDTVRDASRKPPLTRNNHKNGLGQFMDRHNVSSKQTTMSSGVSLPGNLGRQFANNNDLATPQKAEEEEDLSWDEFQNLLTLLHYSWAGDTRKFGSMDANEEAKDAPPVPQSPKSVITVHQPEERIQKFKKVDKKSSKGKSSSSRGKSAKKRASSLVASRQLARAEEN